jgi:membrane protein YqaA with SNARE-associated domain
MTIFVLQIAIFISQSFARTLIAFFVSLGFAGPFLLEVCDCSYLYLPLANELLLTRLIAGGDAGAWWIIYPLMSGAGAAVGVLLLDLPARKAGEKGLKKLVDPKKTKWFTARLEKRAGLAIFVASFMPPPFPFRAAMIAASALQTPRAPMLLGVFFGRWLRYTVEALLILHFGRKLVALMDSDAFDYVIYALTAVALVGSLIFIRKWFGNSKSKRK